MADCDFKLCCMVTSYPVYSNYFTVYCNYFTMYYLDVGSYIKCGCDLKHDFCVNSSCKTELRCQRIVGMNFITKNIIRDDQLCPREIGDESFCNKVLYQNNTYIHFMWCCRTGDYCNSNNTAMEEYLKTLLSMYT